MNLVRSAVLVAFCASATTWAVGTSPTLPADNAVELPPPSPDEKLSVLTYNVRGLPWPIALGRSSALRAIGARLRAMRARGSAPRVIVLQEAFTPDAQQIAATAGYRYRARGPDTEDTSTSAPTDADRRFAAGAHWWKGETEGKLVGSGLQILSDYPIVAVRRMAFPAFACAGFDCLANKGVLLACIAVPGMERPIDVVTTHLNSRLASGVDNRRSSEAYRLQVAQLTGFLRAFHDPLRALLVAGDFNAGHAQERRDLLLAAAHLRWNGSSAMADALGQAERQGLALPRDAAESLRRGKDWQFFGGGASHLELASIRVPIGHDSSARMLSDHIGYVAGFRLRSGGPPQPSAAALTRTVRSRG